MTEVENNIKLKAKLIDSTVFDSFKTLTSEVDAERLNGSLALLNHLNKNQQNEEKHTKERDYSLTRLIRGLGASSSSSRAGFFTTLVGFLSVDANQDITHEQIIAILKKQLHVGKNANDKEDSDALIGHILLCGALLRTKRLLTESNENISEYVDILVSASNKKLFHASLAYKFLVDLLNELSDKQFAGAMWPIMQKELKRPWERHNCNTIHFLMATKRKYPEYIGADFLQSSLKTADILTPIAHKHIGRIYWGTTSLAAITHPAYDELSRFLLNVKRKELTAFWKAEIDVTLAAPNKIKEVVTLKLLTDFLNATESIDGKTFLKLLTPRFIKMIIFSLKALKQQKHDVLVTFYTEFFDALTLYFDKQTDDAIKVEIIKKFILHPGNLLLETYLPQSSIHQLITKLKRDGLVSLFGLYKSIFLAKQPKDPKDDNATWLNTERHNAAQMMQYLLLQKAVQQDIDWRTEQLKFLLNVCFFHVSATGEIVQKSQDSGNITKDMLLLVKNLFYKSLQIKLPNLQAEKQVLLSLVEHSNTILSKNGASKYLKEPLADKALKSWSQMFETVQRTQKNKTLHLTFSILFLHMGLQLFREPDMAQIAIADLVQCLDKTSEIKKKARRSVAGNESTTGQEPEWIEVVVDLVLHLLSQNTSIMRSVVSSVFPHLCPNMTLTAVHQILSMLDMKDGKNPLSTDAENELEAESENDDVDMKSESEGSDDDEKDDDDDDDADDDDDDEDVEEDEGTVTDQFRNAVSKALGSNQPDTDAESVDLNDMKDDEAERLDAALSAAFQLLKNNSGGNSKKKSKKERTTNTTVMHFRIRVLDLIEIYLKHKPAFSISLEILLAMYNMIEYCTDSELKPLSAKVNSTLILLLSLREFSNTDDVTAENLCDFLKSLLEKKINPKTLIQHNQLLTKSFHFIITNSGSVPGDATLMINLIKDFAKEYLASKSPTMPYSLLQGIFNIRWAGVWKVAKLLTEEGLETTLLKVRRRTQLLELLTIMYKNVGFIKSDSSTFNKSNKSIEGNVQSYVSQLTDTDQMSFKEFEALINLLLSIHLCHKQPEVKSQINWNLIGEQVQKIREHVPAVSINNYSKFCNTLGLKAVQKSIINGKKKRKHSVNEENTPKSTVPETASEKVSKKKRKTTDENEVSSKKEKKLKKAERLRISSEGFNGFSFSRKHAGINSDED